MRDALGGVLGVRLVGLFQRALTAHSKLPSDRIGSIFSRIGGEVRAPGRSLGLCVAEKLSDYGQALAGGDGGRGEGMLQIVDADRSGAFSRSPRAYRVRVPVENHDN